MILGASGLEFRHFSDNEFLRRFTDESSLGRGKPIYKFIHLITPHPPMVVDQGNLPARIPLEHTRENFKRQSGYTLDSVVGFLDKLRALAIYDDSTIIIQSDHGGGESFKLQETESGQWIDSLKSRLRVWGAVLPLLLVKPAQSGGLLRISEAQVELNDLPATISALLRLPENFGGKNVFAVKGGEIRDRRFYLGMSQGNDASKFGYFKALQEYVISGSIFKESSWRKGRLYQKPAEFRDADYLWGTLLTFGKTGNVHRFLLDGWSVPSEDATWAEAEDARLSFRVTAPNSNTVVLSVTMVPFIVQDRLFHQRVLVHINDEPIGEWILTEKAFQTYSIAVPANHFQEKEVVVGFRFPNAAVPKEMGVNSDVRTLAAYFRDITLHDGDGP